MGCQTCSLSTSPSKGCGKNGSCVTGGCGKLGVHDWLAHMTMPDSYQPFPVVEVRFKGSRKEYYVNDQNIPLEAGTLVAVEAPMHTYDVGHVSLVGELVRTQMAKHDIDQHNTTKKIYRQANPTDIEKWQSAKSIEWSMMHVARKLALNLGLSMKITDVDCQGDKTKATFYYTADTRVDFRDMVKQMVQTFHMRIEMRQIGMRQEASRLGGIGSCGRELCCATWLTEFKTVSTSTARYQNLSLNTLKLAGQCGKLKCCLNYELDTYLDALQDIPKGVRSLKTEQGTLHLQRTDIFKKIMWFSYTSSADWMPIPVDQVRAIHQMNQSGQLATDLGLKPSPATKTATVFDYENVVGQDSLTRLDRRKARSKSKKRAKAKQAAQGTAKTSNA